MTSFPFYKQLDSMDCGPTCLRMIAKWYGKSYSIPFLREKCYIDRAGVSLKGISEAAELLGFRTLAVKIPMTADKGLPSLMEAPLPAILHWNQNHFVTLFRINNKYAWIADPASGKSTYETGGNIIITKCFRCTAQHTIKNMTEKSKCLRLFISVDREVIPWSLDFY